jgi:hypothetical protein
MRLFALYSLDKRMLALMLTSFVLALTISGYILASMLSKNQGVSLHGTLLNYLLNADSDGNEFTIRWNVLLSNEPPTKILPVLGTVDSF